MIRKAWLKTDCAERLLGGASPSARRASRRSRAGASVPDVRPALSPQHSRARLRTRSARILQPDNSNPPTGNAALPPDPPLPEWGNYSRQPEPVPVRLPPLSYELVGPPRGIVQPDTGQFYGQVLGDPIGLPETDTSLSQAIDLARPDGLAPVGVHGDHTLKAGRVLLSARYDQQTFDGNCWWDRIPFVERQRAEPISV